ncbi:hypothetical protein C8F01DRAFT_1032735, partial [Mycena amicta]
MNGTVAAPSRSAQVSILSRLKLISGSPKRTPQNGAGASVPEGVDMTGNPDEDPYSKAENEEACAQLWSIYVTGAEKYDAALVESWLSDMKGMLIFSGLFSASVTAFIVESYRNLQPTSTEIALSSITQLLALQLGVNTTAPMVAEVVVSKGPTQAALICNALWFISLCLSLTCALLATLVEQWAREFLHKSDARSSPVRRARIVSFLYFGLQRFRMHTVVDMIPLLLHIALFLFLAGLVTFLVPVNRIVMGLVCAMLLLFVFLYGLLTVLPLTYLDCPFSTPISVSLWSIGR